MIQPQMPETKHWSFHRDVENLGWLTINTPGAPVNTLSREAIMELEALVTRFEELAQTGELAGVILLSRARIAALSPAPIFPNSMR